MWINELDTVLRVFRLHLQREPKILPEVLCVFALFEESVQVTGGDMGKFVGKTRCVDWYELSSFAYCDAVYFYIQKHLQKVLTFVFYFVLLGLRKSIGFEIHTKTLFFIDCCGCAPFPHRIWERKMRDIPHELLGLFFSMALPVRELVY